MKRRVRNAIRDTLNDVVHGRAKYRTKVVPETGTTVYVERRSPTDYSMTLSLKGDDMVQAEEAVASQ